MSDRLKNSLILGAGSLALAFLLGGVHLFGALHHCPFKLLTGIPCPGCGGLRALQLLFQGRFLDALWMNPLSVLLIVFFATSGVWLVVDIVRGTRSWLDFVKRKYPNWVAFAVVAALLVNWGWNIYKGL